MKMLFLAGVATLFLATGTAHADKCTTWQCGKIEVEACVTPGGLKTSLGRERDISFHFLTPPIRLRSFKMKDLDDVPMLDGKYCKEILRNGEK